MKKQDWTFKEIEIGDLVLWDNNPRTFDKNSPNPNQKEIISRYQADKLLRIAKNILKYQNDDLQPGELTVVEKGKKFVVFDGNRRISAYKVLLNPDLATDEKDKFVDLSKKVSFSDKKKLRFNVAPNIESALSRIDDLHNNNFHENWNPIARSNFAMINIDGQIKELKEKRVHLKRDSLYKKIKSFSYDKETADIINDPNKFSITTLERIVDSSVGKEYLNYDFNEKGEIIAKGDEKKFNQILKKIADDVALGIADSRKQHNNIQKEKYFKDLFDVLGLSKDNKSVAKNKKLKGTVRKKPQLTRKKVLPQVKKLINEFYDLDSYRFANAKNAFARIIFEAILKYIVSETLWKKKKIKQYSYFKAAFPKNKKSMETTNFTELKRLFTDIILVKDDKKAFDNFDLDHLHQSVHNYKVGVGPADSINYANNLMALIEFMLQDEVDLFNSIDTSKLV
jgi:hypothetical protein